MKIDIVTGFLGAGKTTFISKYVKYLSVKDEKILIIENEFGMAGIDGALLRAEELSVVEIAGGCVCCTQKAKLIEYICEASRQNFDRVIIEPSGIYNLDTFFSLFEHEYINEHCTLNGIITIVKPDFMKFSSMPQYEHIFLSHFLSTGAILVSDTQSYSEEEIDKVLLQFTEFTMARNDKFDLSKINVYTKNWADITDEDLETLSSIGQTNTEHELVNECHINIVENHFFLARFSNYDNMLAMIDYLLNNQDILRIKGFASVDGELYSINYTHNCKEIKLGKYKHPILNVLGINLDAPAINAKVKELES
ncbi:MAG: hypothetical protein BEN19_01845 [Epulopiscium sp. Nuni2H_MBin003]|nr:MAG: hypothetical protein BEN19_01845 [Epulopiscium sp. Nuni2H_MBin003]